MRLNRGKQGEFAAARIKLVQARFQPRQQLQRRPLDGQDESTLRRRIPGAPLSRVDADDVDLDPIGLLAERIHAPAAGDGDSGALQVTQEDLLQRGLRPADALGRGLFRP